MSSRCDAAAAADRPGWTVNGPDTELGRDRCLCSRVADERRLAVELRH